MLNGLIEGKEILKMDADKSNHYAYNKKLQPIANKLRKEMTKAEACLWKYALRAGKMKGYQFRRQRPVLRYIADFMCKELKLVIEVDGLTHQYEEISEKDRQKKHDLEQAGFKVIRFTDEEVLKNMNGVIKAIESVVEEREKPHPLNPPPAGDSYCCPPP
ncbi:MAG: endonuclease domain-containing protein [Candidatus Brocadiaceae bacterium]|nr:endonuclease domain-containing protein [Candidatus Brocadiaceae bacterium]